jgi:hypothetical protein
MRARAPAVPVIAKPFVATPHAVAMDLDLLGRFRIDVKFVKRTAEWDMCCCASQAFLSAVRFTDLVTSLLFPAVNCRGYYQSSATRGLGRKLLGKVSGLIQKGGVGLH